MKELLELRRDYYRFREDDAGTYWSHTFMKMKEAYQIVLDDLKNTPELDKNVLKRMKVKCEPLPYKGGNI